MDNLKISVIIPTYNEASVIERTLKHFFTNSKKYSIEIIVSDGGSTDETTTIASGYGNVICTKKGRAVQLNDAARIATGDILFFVHADMIIPEDAIPSILSQINDGYDGGAFANEFDLYNKKIKRLGRIMNLRIFSKKEQSDRCIFYGDNGIFVRRNVFNHLGGFCEIPIMEDYDFSIRMKKQFKVKQISDPKLIVSARRHIESGFIKTRLLWILIRKLYQLGVSPHWLAKFYADVR